MATLPGLEAALAAKVAALSATAYAQDGHNAEWVETPALSLADEGRSRAHLAFALDAIEQRREDDQVQERAQVQVQFLYHLRSDRQRSDKRLAQSAARAVVDALDANDATLDADVLPALTYRELADVAGEWLLVTTTYVVLYDY